jgi:hypothetical protein
VRRAARHKAGSRGSPAVSSMNRSCLFPTGIRLQCKLDEWMFTFATGLLYDVVSSALEGRLPDVVGLLLRRHNSTPSFPSSTVASTWQMPCSSDRRRLSLLSCRLIPRRIVSHIWSEKMVARRAVLPKQCWCSPPSGREQSPFLPKQRRPRASSRHAALAKNPVGF